LNIVLYGLSDHSAQLLQLQSCTALTQEFTSCCVTKINNFTVDEFQSELNSEVWEDIFKGFYANVTFSKICNI